MDALKPDHYWKTPFYWDAGEAGSPLPPAAGSLGFAPADDAWLLDAIAAVMQAGTDESDRFNVARQGAAAAARELLDLLPQYFVRPADAWRVATDDAGRRVGFVLPVLFKEERFWRGGRPQGTILYLGVLPDARGRGHSLELVHEATRTLARANCWRIFCDTGTNNTAMVRTFRRAGYAERAPWQRPLA